MTGTQSRKQYTRRTEGIRNREDEAGERLGFTLPTCLVARAGKSPSHYTSERRPASTGATQRAEQNTRTAPSWKFRPREPTRELAKGYLRKGKGCRVGEGEAGNSLRGSTSRYRADRYAGCSCITVICINLERVTNANRETGSRIG